MVLACVILSTCVMVSSHVMVLTHVVVLSRVMVLFRFMVLTCTMVFGRPMSLTHVIVLTCLCYGVSPWHGQTHVLVLASVMVFTCVNLCYGVNSCYGVNPCLAKSGPGGPPRLLAFHIYSCIFFYSVFQLAQMYTIQQGSPADMWNHEGGGGHNSDFRNIFFGFCY